jgi:hypothetical protein
LVAGGRTSSALRQPRYLRQLDHLAALVAMYRLGRPRADGWSGRRPGELRRLPLYSRMQSPVPRYPRGPGHPLRSLNPATRVPRGATVEATLAPLGALSARIA